MLKYLNKGYNWIKLRGCLYGLPKIRDYLR